MKLFRFEMSKLWRQKKFLWLFLIVLLAVAGIFTQSYLQQSKMGERAVQNMQFYAHATDELYAVLNALYREDALDERQEKQYEYSNNMATALFHWKSAIFKKEWNEVPTYENEFLTNLLEFENAGGEFTALEGLDKELAILKNDWLLANELSYEDEIYPTSPALFLKDSTGLLFGALGIFLILLLFGNTITVEKTQHTWSTLKTQPIAKWKLITAKYSSILMMMLVFITMVVGIGLAIPLLFSDYAMNLQFPQILLDGERFAFVSTFEYLIRGIVLFICACIFAFSLHFLISTWVRNSFGALMITGLILILGFFATDLYGSLQSVFNPFYYFHIPQILSKIPQSLDWLIPLGALIWSFLLVTLSIKLPEKELSLFGSSENKNPYRRGQTRKSNNAVWTINVLEWRKIRRNGLLKQLYIILSLLVVFGYFVVTEQAKEKESSYLEELVTIAERNINEAAPSIKGSIERVEEELKLAEEADDEFLIDFYTKEIEESENLIASFWDYLEDVKATIVLYKNNNWLAFQKFLLDQNEEFKKIDEIAQGPKTISKFTIDVSIAEKEWLIEHNIQPVFGGAFIPTIHDNWQDEPEWKKDWEETNQKIDNSGLFSLYLYFDKYFYFIPMLLFLFLLGAGFASEKGKKATLQLLKTQPITENNIFTGKTIQATLIALLSSLGLITLIILTGTVFNRFGDWDYPILRYVSKRFMSTTEFTGIRTFEGGGYFISLGNYLVESMTLFLIATLFLISLSIFLSLFLKSQMGVLATTILIGVVGYVGSNMLLIDKAHLSPFTYLNIPKIINGEFSALLNNPSITFQNGMMMLFASILILYFIGHLLLSVKNRF